MEHPIKRPTYEEHISKLFTAKDKSCMTRRGVDLATYAGVKASSSKISEWIGSGRMPPPMDQVSHPIPGCHETYLSAQIKMQEQQRKNKNSL